MPTTLKKGQKVKFVVNSADEAVNMIRAEMGPNAKVLSVRQVEGKGLAKFLTAPKLEIVATLEEPVAEPAAAPVAVTGKAAGFSSEEKALLEQKAPAEPAATSAGKIFNFGAKVASEDKLAAVLRAAGFDASLIRRFETSLDWQKLQRVPVKTALADVARRLRLDYDAVKVPATTQSIAFMGSSGVGKTTALCKQLAYEVFFQKRSIQVLKLDSDTPNADTALALYCEVMGVPLIRDVKAVEPTAALLVDTGSITIGSQEELQALKSRLDQMGVQTRAWVINAAYDNTVIDRSLAAAEELGATHTVYTHLDELASSSRLWQFVLSGRMPVWFGSEGPGVAHDRTSDVGGLLLQKTFPDYLLK